MPFWNQTYPEPLRQYRWYINFTDEGLNASQYALKSCDKPSFEINVTEHTLLNNVHKYPGVLKWKPINIKMASVISTKGAASLTSVLQNFIMKVGGYQPDNGSNKLEDGSDGPLTEDALSKKVFSLNPGISKTYSNLPFGEKLELIQIDENGNKVEIWTLHKAFISNIDYGKLDYGSEEIVDISFTLNYDYATVVSRNL